MELFNILLVYLDRVLNILLKLIIFTHFVHKFVICVLYFVNKRLFLLLIYTNRIIAIRKFLVFDKFRLGKL